MVDHLLISTVGTSLLSNFARTHEINLDNIEVSDKTVKELVEFINKVGEEKASSETNSLTRIIQDLDEKPHIVLLCSDTPQCEVCGLAIKEHLRSNGITVELDKVVNLKYDEKKFESDGLRNLVNKVIEYVKHGIKNGYKVIINATPGFKAESAIITVIAMLYKLDVYYIHEKFRDLIRIPNIPIEFDLEKWRKWKYAMNELRTWKNKKEFISKHGAELYQELKPLLEEENDEIRLGPIGIAYYLAALDHEKQTEG